MSMLGSWAPTSQESFLYQQDLFELRIFSDVFSDFQIFIHHKLTICAALLQKNTEIPSPWTLRESRHPLNQKKIKGLGHRIVHKTQTLKIHQLGDGFQIH